MTRTIPKPWVTLAGAAVVTLTAYAGFIGGDVFGCGNDHAGLMAVLTIIFTPIAAAVVVPVVALLLAMWRNSLDPARIGLTIGILTLAAALGGTFCGMHLGDGPMHCRIDL